MPVNQPASLPVEEIAHFPLPGMAIPTSITFRPDDQAISYLFSPEGSLTNLLYSFDPETGQQSLLAKPPDGGVSEQNVSLEEALRRERQRQRALGITQYQWVPRKNMLLIPLKGDLYVQREPGGTLEQILDSQGKPAIDPQISPDGEWVAYVQDAEVYVLPLAGGEPRQVTHGARGTGKTHGLAEYIAQEEMDRSRGFWWSPDSRTLAFEEVDETHIPVYRIVHQGKAETGVSAQEDHHYPFAGAENARVRLGIVLLEGGEPVWMDLGPDSDFYLARVNWLPNGALTAQLLNRAQNELRLVRFGPTTGQQSLLITETSDSWVNLHNLFYPLKKTPGFLWASERSGYRHLYHYDLNGRLIHALTSGDWMVDSLAGVDEERGLIYFLASKETPLESHLYAVDLAGGKPRLITDQPGMHAVVLDHCKQRFIDVFSAVNCQPGVTLRSLQDGSLLKTIFDRPDPRVSALDLHPPELVSLKSRDGVTLYGAVYLPPENFGPGPYPTIVQVYGGPHVQVVSNNWTLTVSMRAQYLRSLGFLVFMLDNRGSARRGLAFESSIYHDMGHLEVQDQVDGARWLVEQELADPDRIGIYGWSYGGYMSAMCLARASETFKAAVAGAPVAHWDGYDTCYTERYMGTPQNNPQGYEESNVMRHIPEMKGKLMLVHGLIDENVHFRHTARLINALIQARKPYELLIFPDERHMPRKEADRIYMEERIRDFFVVNL